MLGKSFHRALMFLVVLSVLSHIGLAVAKGGGGIVIDEDKSLLITDLRVIEDPVRTDPTNGDEAVWSFKYLIEQMSGNSDPSDFAEGLFSFGNAETINGIDLPPRPAVNDKILDPWPRLPNGKLDLTQAPIKLLAIVYRPDLRTFSGNRVTQAGEGRFIFGVLDSEGRPLAPIGGSAATGMTLIFEYALPAMRTRDIERWAEGWVELSEYDLDDPDDLEDYLDDLEDLTGGFADGGTSGSLGRFNRRRPNESSLNQIRSNDIALSAPWELREWVIDASTGLLRPETVAGTPDFLQLNGTEAFRNLVNNNEAAIMDGTFILPNHMESPHSPSGPFAVGVPVSFINAGLNAMGDQPFSGAGGTTPSRTWHVQHLGPGVVANIPWSADGINNNEARHQFALNTCAGCHRDETDLGFLQVGFPASVRTIADGVAPQDQFAVVTNGLTERPFVSAFLKGGTARDPVTDEERTFDDLQRRVEDLMGLVEDGCENRHSPNVVH